jgi:hypothetical protein
MKFLYLVQQVPVVHAVQNRTPLYLLRAMAQGALGHDRFRSPRAIRGGAFPRVGLTSGECRPKDGGPKPKFAVEDFLHALQSSPLFVSDKRECSLSSSLYAPNV